MSLAVCKPVTGLNDAKHLDITLAPTYTSNKRILILSTCELSSVVCHSTCSSVPPVDGQCLLTVQAAAGPLLCLLFDCVCYASGRSSTVVDTQDSRCGLILIQVICKQPCKLLT